MNTLLKKAHEIKGSKQTKFSKDEIELALAYVTGEINFNQVQKALKTQENSSTQIYSFISRALRQHYFKKMENIEQRIAEIIGEASMCWSETPSGTFNSKKAKELVDEIMAHIKYPIYEDKQ